MAPGSGVGEYALEIRVTLQYAAMGARDAEVMRARAHMVAARAAESLRTRGLLLAYEVAEKPREVQHPKYRPRKEVVV